MVYQNKSCMQIYGRYWRRLWKQISNAYWKVFILTVYKYLSIQAMSSNSKVVEISGLYLSRV